MSFIQGPYYLKGMCHDFLFLYSWTHPKDEAKYWTKSINTCASFSVVTSELAFICIKWRIPSAIIYVWPYQEASVTIICGQGGGHLWRGGGHSWSKRRTTDLICAEFLLPGQECPPPRQKCPPPWSHMMVTLSSWYGHTQITALEKSWHHHLLFQCTYQFFPQWMPEPS